MSYIILDARGLLMRDYYGSTYKTINTPEGSIASWSDGLSAFIDRTLWPLVSITPPRQILACFDGGNTYRRGLFPNYKQKRRERDSALDKAQVREVELLQENSRRLMGYLGVKSVWVPGEEADDLISLLCQRLDPEKVLVYTRDADLLQLVDHRVSVSFQEQIYACDGFGLSSYDGIPVRFIRLKKSIVGDTSDGYPGVKGAGPKFFQELLEQFGEDGLEQLEAIVASPHQDAKLALVKTGSKHLDKLYDQFDEWKLSYRLASLAPDICYGPYTSSKGITEPKRPEWYARIPNAEKVRGILSEVGVGHRLSEVLKWFPEHRLITADQAQTLVDLMPSILSSPIVSYDFESSDKLQHQAFQKAGGKDFVDVLSQELAGISVNFGDNLQQTIYVPFDHANTNNFGLDWAKWLLQSLDTRPDRAVVQNANFELSVAKVQLGLELRAPYDTAIMSSYVDENEEGHLKAASFNWLKYRQATYKEVTGGRAMWELSGDEVLSYGCDDSLVTSHLFDIKRLVMRLEKTWDFYQRYEIDPAVDDVETFVSGTDIDLDLMKSLQDEAARRVEEAEQKIHASLSEYVNDGNKDAVIVAAQTILQSWWELDKFKYEDDPKRAEAAYQALWEKAWNGCFYASKTEEPTVYFIPTPNHINKLIEGINPNLPRIERVSGTGVVQWFDQMQIFLEAWEKYLRKQMKESVLDHAEVEAHEAAKELARRLFMAKNYLAASSRTGKHYDDLKAFCEGLLRAKLNAEKKQTKSINWKSQQQMTTMLYGMLRLPIRRKSKVQRGSKRDKLGIKGPPATGLKAIAAALVYDVTSEDDWRLPILLNYREICLLQQEYSLYYKKYPLWVHPVDGKLHPQIRNCGTVTRRPSGSSPNDLQVSKKDGAKLRKCYVGGDYGDGQRLYVSADFASQELQITAFESRDPVMMDAFLSEPRKDLHSLTSSGFAHTLLTRMGIPTNCPLSYEDFMDGLKGTDETLKKALSEIRNKYGKGANFLMVYGGGHTTMAENLLIAEDLAKEIMDKTFALYARLHPWQQETVMFARQHGYVVTPYGNRRHAEKELYSESNKESLRQGRQLVNYLAQGTAADILKVVRQSIFDRQMRKRYGMRAVKPVYDEISASIPIDLVPDYAQELIEVMSVTPPGYPVPMRVELSIGTSWGSVKELKDTSRESITKMLEDLKATEK